MASARLKPVGRAKDHFAVLPPSAADLPPRAHQVVAAEFDTVAEAAEECDGPVATGVPLRPMGVWR